jgi:hypothetical protein
MDRSGAAMHGLPERESLVTSITSVRQCSTNQLFNSRPSLTPATDHSMFHETQPSSYYSGCNQALLRAVRPSARRILEVGCAEGHLGAALKHRRPDRTVSGIERQAGVGARAAERLDRVFCLDIVTQLDRDSEGRFGPLGVAGVYGVGNVIQSQSPLAVERVGWVLDRGRLLHDGPELPARVATLNELLLVVRRGTPLRFDPALGFHLYGADICLQAHEQGLAVVALGALSYHNSRSVGLPAAFFASAEVFARKWRQRLPVATPCVVIDRGGDVHVLGNATAGPRSTAYALPCRGPEPAELRIRRNFEGTLSAG